MNQLSFSAGALLMVLQSLAFAQDDYLARTYEEGSAAAASSGSDTSRDYWTPERFESARPVTPSLNVGKLFRQKNAAPKWRAAADMFEDSQITNAKPPRVRIKPDTGNRLFTPETGAPRTPPDALKNLHGSVAHVDVMPQNTGTRRAHFTSSRLIPLSADRQYPYRAVGKLFFSVPGVGPAQCSAAVIRPRIILTAGHCVHSGSGGSNGFFTNFVFVPAFRDGVAPFQRWDWTSAFVPTTWTTGRSAVPNAADYALVELRDRAVNGAVRRVGMVTGMLGVQTLKLHPNHAHLLGYPSNLDGGLKMHQVTASSFAAGGNNTIIYGSDMGRGSSGGPWVQNFQVRAAGQTGGSNPGSNLIVGVTSYGAVGLGPRYEGSSILDSRFTSILNAVCARKAGNCR